MNRPFNLKTIRISDHAYVLRSLFILLLGIGYSNDITAQSLGLRNYALNGSLEDISDCPRGEGGITLAKHYFRSLSTSTDLFARCGGSMVSVPQNQVGFQQPYDGNNMAGIMATTKKYSYYDYLIGTLDYENMTAGREYCVSFKVSLADESPWALDQLALSFCDSNSWEIIVNSSGRKYYFNPLIRREYPLTALGVEEDLTDRDNWVNVKGKITYLEGMKYFWIGANHRAQKGLIPINAEQNTFDPDHTVYYFIDDIRITDPGEAAYPLSLNRSTDCKSSRWVYNVTGSPQFVQWFVNGRIITGANNSSFKTDIHVNPQTVTALAVFNDICDTTYWRLDSNINYPHTQALNRYYPNPTTNDLYLNVDNAVAPRTMITDMVGRKIRVTDHPETSGFGVLTIPVNDLAPAVYHVVTRSGNCVWSQKVIVQ